MPQIAKNVYGCKVIGSAGGPEKCALVTGKFGFDACIDYKSVSTAEELGAALKAHAPEGIDMYFEVRWGCTFQQLLSGWHQTPLPRCMASIISNIRGVADWW